MSSKVCLAQNGGYIFIVTTAMTPDQVRTVQESFGLLTPHAAEAARMFYDELFHIAPEARELFPKDMTGQHRKFVQMLATVVKSLHPNCYKNNPNFVGMAHSLGLKFRPHNPPFSKADIAERSALIQSICEAIWDGTRNGEHGR